MRIAHGMFAWQDGRLALEAALRSTTPFVDEIIIADGLIEGVPDLGLPHHSDLAWLADPSDFLPEHVWVSCGDAKGIRPWASLSAACTWILGKAASLGCDWLLTIDADQELHNGLMLRPWLARWPGDALPIRRSEPNGKQMECPWQLIRTNAFKRYVSGCSILETFDGRTVSLVPPNAEQPFPFQAAPWISHHPERRPPWRRAQRLGSVETLLEPPPAHEPLTLPRPTVESAA